MSDYTALDAGIAALNLEYTAQFIPKRESRNKDKEELQINWRITLAKAHAVFTCDYSTGLGLVPGYSHSDKSKFHCERIAQAAVTGKYYTAKVGAFKKDLPKPELRDVLYGLVSDSDVLETSGFEDWASSYGFDTDSRKAEALYRECLEQALKFKALIGQENLDTLRTLFEGY